MKEDNILLFSVKLVARQFLTYQSNVTSCIGRYKMHIWETFLTAKWKWKPRILIILK